MIPFSLFNIEHPPRLLRKSLSFRTETESRCTNCYLILINKSCYLIYSRFDECYSRSSECYLLGKSRENIARDAWCTKMDISLTLIRRVTIRIQHLFTVVHNIIICVYVCVCVCVYIYICACIYIYIYIYMHTHIFRALMNKYIFVI